MQRQGSGAIFGRSIRLDTTVRMRFVGFKFRRADGVPYVANIREAKEMKDNCRRKITKSMGR
jgi:hypothetical protein